MKKTKLFGLATVLLGTLFWGLGATDVYAEQYAYAKTQEEVEGSMQDVNKWYHVTSEGRTELAVAPENVTSGDVINIEAVPDEECSNWLKGLTGDLGSIRVTTDKDVTVQIGTEEGDLFVQDISTDSGNIIAYADAGILSVANGYTADGSTYGGDITLYGDVSLLGLGIRDMRTNPMTMIGNIQVHGNVNTVAWTKSLKSDKLEDVYYTGFVGSVSVTGEVAGGEIYTVSYDEDLQKDIWKTTGFIGKCEAGIFEMTDGVLSDSVPVTEKEVKPGNYIYEYQCYQGDGTANKWTKVAYDIDNGGAYAFMEDCKLEDIPDGADVMIFGTAEPETIDINLNRLAIINNQQGRPVEATINGAVNYMYMEIITGGKCEITINGDVESMSTSYRYNPQMNLTITGKVTDGSYSVRKNKSWDTVGYFSTENMPIIINGEWNPQIFMYPSMEEKSTAYHPIGREDILGALKDFEIGKEIKIDGSDLTLVKEAEVLIKDTQDAVLEALKGSAEIQSIKDKIAELFGDADKTVESSEPVCALDIFVNSFYADKSTGDEYTDMTEYGYEAITSLAEGEALPFTIKIPELLYDKDAKYVVVREHEEGGKAGLEILDVKQNGDTLSFESDKFSTFMIMKAEVEEHEWEEGKVTKAATWKEEGIITYKCKDCEETKEEKIPITEAETEKPNKIANVISGVHVYWKEVAGVEKYGLWRSETGKNGSYKWIANPTLPHFTDTKVESGKTYYYKVTILNTEKNLHTKKSDALGITYVGTPDITSRINKAAGVQLGWNKITGATGYAIYRKSYSGNDAWARVATISGNSTFTWTDESVKAKNGEVYKYTIRALAGSNMKTLSGCRDGGRTMVRLASRVLNSATKSKTSATSITCTWTTSSAVTGYEVRFMDGDKVVKTQTIGSYKTGTKTFTGLTKGKKYKVQVRSYKKVDGVGSFYSAWSVAKYVQL